MISNK
jgi:cellulose synthase/poly-beta-1,6-N-acetylglucosamine synthase-like glycosyltransferase